MTEKFVESFASFFSVISSLDTLSILDLEFPAHSAFIEPLPNKITSSYLNFVESNGEAEYEKTTLNKEKTEYITVYDVYHDLHVACLTKMEQVYQDLQDDGAMELYTAVDKFYRVSTELLLREAINLGIVMKYDREIVSSNLEAVDKDEVEQLTVDLETKLANQFNMITTAFYSANGETLSLTSAGNIPFFTSLNKKKSLLDDREAIFDDELGIDVVNIIPTPVVESTGKLGEFSFGESVLPEKLPNVLDNYIHPNWLRLMDVKWLKYGEGFKSLNFSFAPKFDETDSVIYNEWKDGKWFQRVGFNELVDMKKQLQDLKKDSEELKDEPQLDLVKADIPYNSRDKIDIRRILAFNPLHNSTEEENEVIKENSVQNEISRLLLKLSELRQQRIKSGLGKVTKPGRKELETYQSVTRLMAGLIQHKNVQPNELNLAFDQKLPVTQVDYCGTLPSNHMGAQMEKSNTSMFQAPRRW